MLTVLSALLAARRPAAKESWVGAWRQMRLRVWGEHAALRRRRLQLTASPAAPPATVRTLVAVSRILVLVPI
ncbi:hypothetical protein GCM10022248_38340 [Nonomuraea soli]